MQLKVGNTNTTAFQCTHRCMYGELDKIHSKKKQRTTNKSAAVLRTPSHKAWNIAQPDRFCYLDIRLIFYHLASKYFIEISTFFFIKEWWNLALTFWWEHLFYVVECITLDVSCTIWPMNFKEFTLADNTSYFCTSFSFIIWNICINMTYII